MGACLCLAGALARLEPLWANLVAGLATLGLLGLGYRWRSSTDSSRWALGLAVLLLLALGRARNDLPAPNPDLPCGQVTLRWHAADWDLFDVAGCPIPIRVPAGWLHTGDEVRLHPSARQERFAAAPNQRADPHTWVADAAQIQRRPGRWRPMRFPWTGWVERLRERFAGRLEQLESASTEGLPRALLLGQTGAASTELRALFTRTGTRHLLALSGLHVGWMWILWVRPMATAGARLGAFGMRLFGRNRPSAAAQRAWLGLVLLLVFVPLLGSGTPAWRAALALGIAGLARRAPPVPGRLEGSGRRVDGLSLWSFALVFECLADPSAPFQLSLQLSYVATLALMCWYPRWQAHLMRRHHEQGAQSLEFGHDSLGRPRSLFLQTLLELGGRWIQSGLLASAVASTATLPWIWAVFGEWCPHGVWITLLLMPAVLFALFFGGLFAVAPTLVPKGLAALPFETMQTLLVWVDGLPGTPWVLPLRSPGWIAALLLLIGLAWMHAGAFGFLARRCALGLGALLFLPWNWPPSAMEVYVCDVGHGTAILARFPCGRTVLFDAGSRDRRGVADRVLLTLLRKLEVGPLTVVVSHADADHAGALPYLVGRLPIEAWLGARPVEIAPSMLARLRHFDPVDGEVRLPACRLDRCRMSLLRGLDRHGNEGSRNLLLVADAATILLAGDAEEEGLESTLEACKALAPLDALLAPHHGSEQKLWSALLRAARPKEIWFSATSHSPLAQRWQGRSLPIRWTARDGGWIATFPGT